METATIRIPASKKDLLKTVASLEKKKMNDIIVKLIDDYAERYRESLELLAIPGFFEEIQEASREFREGGGVPIEDVKRDLEREILAERSQRTPSSRKKATSQNISQDLRPAEHGKSASTQRRSNIRR